MIEQAVRKILLLSVPVAAKTGDRITLGVADQDERRPRIVITLISASLPHTHDGAAGYRNGTLQIACLAPSYREAHDLAEAAATALDNYTGTIEGITIDHLEPEDIEDIDTAPLEGKAVPTFGKAFTLYFMHRTTH